jgi:hypothetical protein
MSAIETARFRIPTGLGPVAFEANIEAKNYDGIALLEVFLKHHGNAAGRAIEESQGAGQWSADPRAAKPQRPAPDESPRSAAQRPLQPPTFAPRKAKPRAVNKNAQLELPRLEIALYGIGRRSAKRRRTA